MEPSVGKQSVRVDGVVYIRRRRFQDDTPPHRCFCIVCGDDTEHEAMKGADLWSYRCVTCGLVETEER